MVGSRASWAALGAAVGVAKDALAAPQTAAHPAAFAVGGALLVAALAALLWAYVAGRVLWRRRRSSRRAIEEARSLLRQAPLGYIAWLKDGAMLVSPWLIERLGLPRPAATFADFFDAAGAAGFPPAAYARLEEMAAAVRGVETLPPTAEIGAARCRFLVSASRFSSGRATLGVLWFQDITDQHQAIAARDRDIGGLKARAAVFEETLNALDMPVWMRDRELRLRWVNDAYARAVEAASGNDAVASGAELIANALTGTGREDAARALADGKPVETHHYVVIDGQRRALRVTDIPRADIDGAIVIGYARDVTTQEELAADIARHTESHSETLNKLSTAVAIFAADKTLEFYNDAFVRLWQLPEEWLSSHPHHGELLEAMREHRRLPEQADFPAWKRLQLARYTDLIEPVEEMWHLPNASTLRVVTQPHPLGGLLIFYEDVTDRLALERSYNTLIAVQRATLNNLHEGVAVFGSDGGLKLSNPAFADIWRLDGAALDQVMHLSDIVGRAQSLFGRPEEYEKFRTLVFADEVERVVRSERLARADGTVIDGSAVPLPDGATLVTFLDVTDSLRIERALRERNEALETADRLKTEFVAHMSYELRTPLNNVIGFAELLDKEYYGPLNAQQHTYTHNIIESSNQLMVLINDILDLAVIEAGGMQLELGSVDVARAIANVAAMVREEIRNRGLRLEIAVPDGIGIIEADEKRIRQVLYNLLSNAMKFTPTTGRISFGAAGDDDAVRIFVADTGIGIDKDEQALVFDRFQRGRAAPQGKGAGLGLSLVRSFVDLHGGAVSLASEPDKGTRVEVTLPRRQARSGAAAAAESRPAAGF